MSAAVALYRLGLTRDDLAVMRAGLLAAIREATNDFLLRNEWSRR